MKPHLLLMMAVGLLLAAHAKADAPKNEMKELEGTWKLIAIGDREAVRDAADVLVFQGNQYSHTVNSEVWGMGTYRIDPSKGPKTLDLLPMMGRTRAGIYEVDSDTLRVCFRDLAPGRPAALTTQSPDQVVLVYKRLMP